MMSYQKVDINEISIRPETPEDYGFVRDLIVEVFHETYGSGEAEATLVEQLRRQPNNALNLSIIAEIKGGLLGHVFFSAVHLEDHPNIPVCVLAPLGVYRQYRNQGIGSQLVQAGIKECVKQGFKAIFVQGNLEYYPRFGFIPICKTNLHTIFKSDHDMVLELEHGISGKVSGLVDYPEPWQVLK